MSTTPYIVSGDIYLLLEKWAKKKNVILPDKAFFQVLRDDFCNYMQTIFRYFEFIAEDEICNYLSEAIHETALPVVSLDPVYIAGNYPIGLTRTVDIYGKNKGIQSRFINRSLLHQMNLIASQGIRDVCIVDDVIFSGELIERVIKLLLLKGIQVKKIYAGIGINEGVSRLSTLAEVCCYRKYEAVVDEVCERDFYLGIPYSGRSLVNQSENMNLPYFLPYGNPGAWASIPEKYQKEFSIFCIKQTITLFEKIEKISSKQVCCSDIERKVVDQPLVGCYVNFLKNIKI